MYKILTLQRHISRLTFHVSPKINLVRLLFICQVAFALLLSPLSYAQESYTFVTKWGSMDIRDGQFYNPQGVAVDTSGNVYVADTENHRIQKFSANGQFLAKWGTQGSRDGEFKHPNGIAVDTSGNVYVADQQNHRIQKFSANGQFITKWGTQGNGDGQFSAPGGIAVDTSGNVYVAEYGNNRIQKFSANGQFITKWGTQGSGDGQFSAPNGIAVDTSGNVYVADRENHRIQKFSASGQFITKWGTQGSGDGQFNYPSGIAVDTSGNVYVIDFNNELLVTEQQNHRIQKFSANGQFITKWGTFGSGDGQFNYPSGIAVDTSGNVYISNRGNNRIQKFSANGQFITKWGTYIRSGDGEFYNPQGVAVDSSGNVYVADTFNNRIQKFSANGQFITKWGTSGSWGTSSDGQFISPKGIAVDTSGNVYVTDPGNHRIQKFSANGQFITKWGTQGSDDGQFSAPDGIAVDTSGNVYVADSNNRIQKFSTNGQFITKWGTEGSGDGQFIYPQGVAVDTSGNVYVVDQGNDRIQKFSANGQFITKWGTEGSGDGQFSSPSGIAVDTSGNVYVADSNNHRIQKFAPANSNPNSTARLINLSANAKLPIIGGLGMSGTGNLRLMFRGFAIDSCVDPLLVLQKYPSGEEVARNDNWQTGGSVSANISDLPSHLTLTNPKDAGLLIDLPVGYYTISLGSNGCNGQGLIGVDLIESASASTAKLINLSANAPVPIIGGLGMSGTGNMQAMFRGFKVDACIDPNLLLQKYPSGEQFANNDNWETDNYVTQVKALPSHLQLPNSVDSGLLRNLTPQYFTATLSTQSGCQGNGLFGLDIVQ